ncbi:MAG: hypothetical protein U0894_20785 [Pirellulales bacterium]
MKTSTINVGSSYLLLAAFELVDDFSKGLLFFFSEPNYELLPHGAPPTNRHDKFSVDEPLN